MKFHVITLLPNMIEAFFDKNIGGVVGAAKDKNLFQKVDQHPSPAASSLRPT